MLFERPAEFLCASIASPTLGVLCLQKERSQTRLQKKDRGSNARDKAAVGFATSTFTLDKIECRVVGHITSVNEVRNDHCGRARYALRENGPLAVRRVAKAPREYYSYLLTVYENVDAPSEAVVYPANSSLKMGFEISRGAIENVESVRLKLYALSGMSVWSRYPWGIENLNERADGVSHEEVGVEDCGERAEVQCTRARIGICGDDEVHGSAHGLHNFWREVVEANHVE